MNTSAIPARLPPPAIPDRPPPRSDSPRRGAEGEALKVGQSGVLWGVVSEWRLEFW